MPVNRKREQVRAVAGRPASGDFRTPGLELAGQAARRMAEQARAYGQTMALAATEEGKSLSKAATFSTGPNGLPVMPPNPTARMGTLAQKSYDAGIEDRFVHQMTTAVRAQIGEAEAENMYDFDAFTVAAQERINTMSGDVPEGFEGAFQQISTGLLADSAAGIGMRQGRMIIENAAAQQSVALRDATLTMNEAVWAGRDDLANSLMTEYLESIDKIPLSQKNDAEKAAMKDKVVFEVGLTRMTRDLNLRELNPGELIDLRERMIEGNDEELLKYFTGPDGSARPDLMADATANINQFINGAYAREKAEQDVNELEGRVSQIESGVADDNPKNRAVLDQVIGVDLGLTDPQGQARGISWSDWLTFDGETRGKALSRVKSSGMIPPSLRGALDRLERQRDPADFVQAFELLRDLDEMPNQQGKVVSMLGEAGEYAQAVYQMVSDLHGDGAVNQEGVASAMLKVNEVWDVRGEWSDDQLVRRMNKENGLNDGRWSVTEDTVRGQIAKDINERVFEDGAIEPLPAERETAARLFEIYYRTGENYEDAMEMTKQSMKGRYQDSEYLAQGLRSAYAPEKHFPTPPPNGFMDMMKRAGQQSKGNSLAALEWIAELPFNIGVTGPWALDVGIEADFNADRLRASPFALMADAGIRELLSGLPDDSPFNTGRGYFKPGRDYILQANPSTGKVPTYRVKMRSELGTWQTIGVLDVRDDWAAFTKFDMDARRVSKIGSRRAFDYGTDWGNIAETLKSGGDPSFNKLTEEYFKNRPSGPEIGK